MAKEINRFRHFSSKVNELLPTYHEDKIRGTSAYLIYEIAGKRIIIVFKQTGVEENGGGYFPTREAEVNNCFSIHSIHCIPNQWISRTI